MERTIAKLYLNLLSEDFNVWTLENSSPTPTETEAQLVNQTLHLEQLFQALEKACCLWKKAPSNKTWVLEQTKDAVIKCINNNPDALTGENVLCFLQEFYEDNCIVLGSDILMNEITEIACATAVHCCSKFEDKHLQTIYNFIRIPLIYGQFDKGFRAKVTFSCLFKLLQNGIVVKEMSANKFDASLALAYALSSPQNYCRKSATEYFVKLVKSAFEELPSSSEQSIFAQEHNEFKTQLKQNIFMLFQIYNEKLQGVSSEDESVLYKVDVKSNYCKIVSECAMVSSGWCKHFAQPNVLETSLFETILVLLRTVALKGDTNCSDTFTETIAALIKMNSFRNDALKLEGFEKLSVFLANIFQTESFLRALDMIKVSGMLLTSCERNFCHQTAVMEFTLLPLKLILNAPIANSAFTTSKTRKLIESKLWEEMKHKSHVLVKASVEAAFAISRLEGVPPEIETLMNYVTCQSLDPPACVKQPFLSKDKVASLEASICLAQVCHGFTQMLSSQQSPMDAAKFEAVQHTVSVCVHYLGISFESMSCFLDCFLASLTHMQKWNQLMTAPLLMQNAVESVLKALQTHMVSMDHNVRELAVKMTRQIYIFDCTWIREKFLTTNMFPSVWKCMEDKAETVISQIVEFSYCLAELMQLENLLTSVNMSKEDLIQKCETILLSRDGILVKPAAFTLLSSLLSVQEMCKYADVSLKQDHSALATCVLSYVESKVEEIVSLQNDGSVDVKIDNVCEMLKAGWGDLLLSKINSQDILCFRQSVDILSKLMCFMLAPNVVPVINRRVLDSDRKKNCHAQIDEQEIVLFWDHFISSKSSYSTDKAKVLQLFNKHKIQSIRYTSKNANSGSEPEVAFETETNSSESSPPIKKQKLEQLDNCQAFLKGVLGSRMRSPPQETSTDEMKNERADVEEESPSDSFLDSTKQLPPLTLKSNMFASECLTNLLDSQTEKDASLIAWFALRELLSFVDPFKLKEEAYRSTNEFERNEEMLLSDLNTQIEVSNKQVFFQMEKELIAGFISEMSNFISKIAEESDEEGRSKFLQPLAQLCLKIFIVSHEKGKLVDYFTVNKRTLQTEFWGKEDPPLFALDRFVKQLDDLKGGRNFNLKEMFQSSDGTDALMNSFVEGMIMKQSVDKRVKFHENVNFHINFENGDKLQSQMSDKMRHAFKELPSDLAAALQNMCSSTCKNTSVKEISEQLFKEYDRRSLTSVLSFLGVLCNEVMTELCEKVEKNLTLSETQSYVAQLEHWFLDEDAGYDSDNDPCMIDCF